jgi:hypothetical protein
VIPDPPADVDISSLASCWSLRGKPDFLARVTCQRDLAVLLFSTRPAGQRVYNSSTFPHHSRWVFKNRVRIQDQNINLHFAPAAVH